jgi:hypothetical protein
MGVSEDVIPFAVDRPIQFVCVAMSHR